MRDPSTAPQKIKDRLKHVGLWDVDPANLFRITWKNEPKEQGGLYNNGNWIEFPSALTGVDARIIGTGRQVLSDRCAQSRGGVWLSGAEAGSRAVRSDARTRRFGQSRATICRGGAFDSRSVGCTAVAILPEEMSRERFDWLKEIGAEVIATPGCESNVKEILRQVLGDSPDAARLRDLQSVRGVRQLDVALSHDRQDDRRDLSGIGDGLAIGCRVTFRPLARAARSRPAIFCGRCIRRLRSPQPRRCNARRSMNWLRRPSHRRDRRQACAVGSQRAEYGHGRGDRR